HPPTPSTSETRFRMTMSANRKKIEATATMTNTMPVVIAVSRRDGHVTFDASTRTSCMNLKRLNFGIPLASKMAIHPRRTDHFDPTAQERSISYGIAAPGPDRGPAGALDREIRS